MVVLGVGSSSSSIKKSSNKHMAIVVSWQVLGGLGLARSQRMIGLIVGVDLRAG